jgi:hypothetical protein
MEHALRRTLFGDISLPRRPAKRKSPRRPLHSREDHAHHVLTMLTEFFGSERRAIEFMRDHAGVVVVLPESDVVERLAQERQIKRRMDRDPQAAGHLADMMDITRRQVTKTYRRAQGRSGEAQHCRVLRIPRHIRFRRRV